MRFLSVKAPSDRAKTGADTRWTLGLLEGARMPARCRSVHRRRRPGGPRGRAWRALPPLATGARAQQASHGRCHLALLVRGDHEQRHRRARGRNPRHRRSVRHGRPLVEAGSSARRERRDPRRRARAPRPRCSPMPPLKAITSTPSITLAHRADVAPQPVHVDLEREAAACVAAGARRSMLAMSVVPASASRPGTRG